MGWGGAVGQAQHRGIVCILQTQFSTLNNVSSKLYPTANSKTWANKVYQDEGVLTL